MPGKRRGGHAMPGGFVSKAQWRYFYATPKLRGLAHKEAHKVEARAGKKTGFHSLPPRKGIRTHD